VPYLPSEGILRIYGSWPGTVTSKTKYPSLQHLIKMNHFINIIAMATIITACGKQEPTLSQEVLVSITNECRAKLLVYDTSEQHQKLMDICDCSYKSILPIYIDEGYYKIITENFQEKKVPIKSRYAITLDMEFWTTTHLSRPGNRIPVCPNLYPNL